MDQDRGESLSGSEENSTFYFNQKYDAQNYDFLLIFISLLFIYILIFLSFYFANRIRSGSIFPFHDTDPDPAK